MKVLYFHQHFTLPTQAGGTRSYEFAQHLIQRGHCVTMVCGETSKLDLPKVKKNIKRGVIDNIDVIQIAIPYSNQHNVLQRAVIFLKFGWQGIRIAFHEKYDLLFATSTPLTAGVPGIVMKLFKKKKFVFEVRDLWPELPKALGLKNPILLSGMSVLEWLSYRFANACIGLSPGICEGIRKRSPKGRKVMMIPNGCDLDIFKPGKRENLKLKGVSPRDTVAIFTGAHGIANGLDAILDAALELKKKQRKDIALVFIGDGKVKHHLQLRAQKEDLNNCHFFPPMPKLELNQIVASADIGMMVLSNVPAFYYGTSPNKFFDYISSGIPVLNNYPGWLSDMIKENKCGVVVPPNDAEAFSNKLIELADNRLLRDKMGKNSRELAERNFSRHKLCEQFVTFLEECMCVN
ncbi:MAG: glycosyltransferase family 4 protein [Mediterranea sp.]|jgi:glycosyltransferase involved in cell wall biosynthesis|nr:glycosyltransferase family 4 protein [Mediterranea sp.]